MSAKFKFAVLLLVSLALSCSSDKLDEMENVNKRNSDVSISTVSSDGFSELSKQYVDNIKTMIYASDALNAPKVFSKRGDAALSQDRDVNPMVEKLKTIKIVDDDSQNIGFYNLPLEEREKFINYLLLDEAKELSMTIERIYKRKK